MTGSNSAGSAESDPAVASDVGNFATLRATSCLPATWRSLASWFRAPTSPPLELYAFGKHPLWRDFIDVRLLPPVPRALWEFHQRTRPMIESATTGDPPHRPMLILWRAGRRAAVVLVTPSRDGSGGDRLSPLFLGVAGFGLRALELFNFAVPRLLALRESVSAQARAEGVTEIIGVAAGAWPREFRARPRSSAKSDSGGATQPADASLHSAAIPSVAFESFRLLATACGSHATALFFLPSWGSVILPGMSVHRVGCDMWLKLAVPSSSGSCLPQ